MPPPLLLLAATVVALPQPDPYAPPPQAGTAERLAYDAELGGAPEDAAIEAWLAKNPKAPAAARAMLLHRLCNDYGTREAGEKRARACQASVALSGDSEDASDLAMAVGFAKVPPSTVTGSAIVPLGGDMMGSHTVDVTVNGVTLPWIFDTGAEVTVLTDSTAAKLGARILDGAADVGTSTSKRVVGRMGVIDKLQIGGVTVTNVQVFILPDAALTLQANYTIPAILGLSVMAAIGRIAWLDGGSKLALGDAAPAPSGNVVRIYWHEDGFGVPLKTSEGTLGAHFDSGAFRTTLFSGGLKLLTPAQIATATPVEARYGGAGGYEMMKVRILPQLDYSLAGAPLTSSRVTIREDAKKVGMVGDDIFAQLDLLTVDFRTMTLSTKPASPIPVPEP